MGKQREVKVKLIGFDFDVDEKSTLHFEDFVYITFTITEDITIEVDKIECDLIEWNFTEPTDEEPRYTTFENFDQLSEELQDRSKEVFKEFLSRSDILDQVELISDVYK